MQKDMTQLTRRSLLRNGAALATAAMISPDATKASSSPNSPTLNLGIAGEAMCFHSLRVAEAVRKDPQVCGNVRIAGVWDRDPEDANQFAKRFDIPLIAKTAEELAEAVDGVMILGGERAWEGRSFTRTRDRSVMGSMVHHRYAEPFLKAGVPTYIDKPLAPNTEEAEDVARSADSTGTPMFSCSPRRFADAVVKLQANFENQVGEVFGGMTCGGLNFSDARFYGIHHLDVLLAIVGDDVVSVQEIGDRQHRLCRLNYHQGFSIMFDAAFGRPVVTRLFLYGRKGSATIPVAPPCFHGLTAAVAQMVRTRKTPVSIETVIQRARIFDAMDRSLLSAKGEKVF